MKKHIVHSAISFVLLLSILLGSVPVVFASNAYTINGVVIHWDDFSSSEDECWEYANQIYGKIWGHRFSSLFDDNENSLRNLGDNELELTQEHLKAYVSNAALGSSLRICNSEWLHSLDGWGHSQIIVQKDSNGFTVFEGGLSKYPYCREKYYTWSEYINTNWLGGTYKYIKYVKWPNASAYTPCDHKYVGCGICKYCNYRFPWEDTKSTRCAGTYKVTAAGGTYPRPDSPYSDAAKSGTLFPKNAKVSVSYSVQNAYGNTWYYCTYNGVSGFVNSSNLTLDSYYTQKFTCVVTSPAEGEVVPKSAYPVVGTLTSQYYKIKEVKAYIDGSCYATVSNVNATSLELRPTDVNHSLDFAALSTGRHVLRIDAKDEKSSSFVTVLNRTFYTEQKEQHTHSYSSAVTTEPTCTTAGVRTYTCSCGASYTETIAALGHVWGTWRTTVNPGCTESGQMERNCMRCGAEETKPIAATGHDWSTWATIYDASCTADGRCERYCKNCSLVESDILPALGHNYVSGTCTRCGAYDPDYYIARGDCGVNLTWTLDAAGTLTVLGTGEMENYSLANFAPWSSVAAQINRVVIRDGVTSIGDCAFEGNDKPFDGLTSVTIPDSVTSIGDNAFSVCSGLTSITIPNSVTSIGYDAFCYCSNLTSITIPDSVTNIGSRAFHGCSGLTSIIVEANNPNYSCDDFGILFNKEKTELICYPGGKTGCYTIPNSVTSIVSDAFSGCSGLAGITIPDRVTSIGRNAFSNCTGLTSITIPNGVTNIDMGVFLKCTGLTSVVIPDSVTRIGDGAFFGCTGLSSVTIPERVKSIDDYAFYACENLETVIVGEGVASIGSYAFAGCDALKRVCFRGNAPALGEEGEVFTRYDAATDTMIVIPGLTLYYVEGKDGWTTPTWTEALYPTATWDGRIVPHPHDYIAVVTKPTCTEQGYTTYTCTVCGDSYTDSYVSALGHSWDGGKVTTAATAEREGIKAYTCTRCGATKTETIAKLPSSAGRFGDVEESAYYAAAVNWAVAANVTNGTSATTFSPDATCTRGQIVTFLWRAAGQPAPSGAANPFSDVKESAYYYNAVLWAVEQGITAGTSETTFSPDEGCTRGQVATFLWRYEGKPSATGSNPFTDIKAGAYYYDAILWAVANGVTNGTSPTTFEPDTTCTRGQIVTFLYRDIVK